MRWLALLSAMVASATAFGGQPGVQIPRSMPGDKGKYFLLDAKRDGDVVATMHKRIGLDSTVYTRTDINCRTLQIRVIGDSEVSPAAIKESPTKWFDLVPGSSKSDLVAFVCRR